MAPQQNDIQSQWFISGEGIDRHVITADIQRYLGNDATVRPGVGTGDNQGMPGFWIKAYRNLTNAMIADLRADSSRWRQEQRSTGTRGPYVESDTYQQGSASAAQRQNRNTDRDSPLLDQYGRDTRRPGQSMDPMAMEGVVSPGANRGYPNQPRGPFPPDNRGQENRRGYPGEPNYPPQPNYTTDMQMSDNYGGRIPVDQSYTRQPGYNGPIYPPNDGAPPGYVRQGEYYIPITGYVQPGNVATAGPGAPQYPPGQQQYNQTHQPRNQREQWDQQNNAQGRRDDTRYGQSQQDYPDGGRYAYPSPATTVAAPNQDWPPSSYAGQQQPQYDQRSRTIQSPQGQPGGFAPGQPQYPAQPSNPANYNRPGPTAEEKERERRRRRN